MEVDGIRTVTLEGTPCLMCFAFACVCLLYYSASFSKYRQLLLLKPVFFLLLSSACAGCTRYSSKTSSGTSTLYLRSFCWSFFRLATSVADSLGSALPITLAREPFSAPLQTRTTTTAVPTFTLDLMYVPGRSGMQQ